MRDFHTPGRSAVYANNGMVATSHPLASQVAIETLKSGGSAMDAAIAGAVLLGICEPQMTGIGGDVFALVQPAPGKPIVAVNGSGRAPKAASADALRHSGATKIPLTDPQAVTIPGAVDAFCAMSDRYGKLGLDQTLAPAIHYAQTGVPVAPRVAFDWAQDMACLSETGQKFYTFGGNAPAVGDIFKAPGQAEVLRKIAKDGRAGFYDGAVAEDMVQALQAAGGHHTLEDFAATQTTFHNPISGDYGDVSVVEHPPNGQGATALLMLNMLKLFDVAAMDPFGPQRVHIEAEIARLAYDARNRLVADADYATRAARMMDPDLAMKLGALIDPNKAGPDAAALTEAIHKDTIYITVVDKDRMAVSLIYSIFNGFGSGITSEKYGILFQNRGAGFTLEQGHPNELAPGKRPMHTIIPGMLMRGNDLAACFGVMGGAYQPNGHARFVSNLVDFGMGPQAAIDAPRSFRDVETLKVERGYSDHVRQELVDMGHPVEIPNTPIGGAQTIMLDPAGILVGASDPRKDGCALGY